MRLSSRIATALFAALCTTGSLPAQSQVWISQFGGLGNQYAGAALKEPSGGIIVAGTTSGDFFLGPGFGQNDAYLARFDDFGGPVWGVRIGTNLNDTAELLAPAENGGVFITGTTVGSLGGPAAGDLDVWLARCDSGGTRLWTRQIGTTQAEYVHAVVPDGVGGCFIAGSTLGVMATPAPGGGDAWIARYDSTGRQVWLRQFGTATVDGINGAIPDGAGGLFVSGFTFGAFAAPLSGSSDAWVGRVDSSGVILWARQAGTTASDSAWGLCANGSGGFFVTGFTTGALGGPNIGEVDGWLARYNASGDRLAITQFGSTGSEWTNAIAADGYGGAFISGDTTGALGGPNVGSHDVWIARADSGLSITWIEQFGTLYYDTASALAPASPGSVFVCGYTEGNIITGGGGGGFADAWLARYDLCYPDCTGDGAQTVADFGCFQSKYVLGDPYADCNASGTLTVADFGCFQGKYVLGCP